jgi:CheY-like chemotaxis protein
MPNVLVFESDSVFAGELKAELEQRGCSVTVVDDASVGLQTAANDKPDLILLTIELPRMNGFSVCNKLKRDPALKEIPLVILSSDSTEETFEQHRRLRTHAEDYVHKPIGFTDLLPRLSRLVPIGETNGGGGLEDIVIDDDIDFEETQESALPEETPLEAPAFDPTTEIVATSPVEHPRSHSDSSRAVDDEVDAFAESAFGAMMDEPRAAPISQAPSEAVPPTDETGGLAPSAGSPAEPAPKLPSLPPEIAPRVSSPPTDFVARAASIPPRPRPDSIDQSLRDDLLTKTERVRELEKQLREAESRTLAFEDAVHREASKDAEVQRLTRELTETKAKLASGAKGAGSAREFLDLREALNKKDKELLDLRDQITHREKELLGLRDTNLAFEREKADLNDRLAEFDKVLSETVRQMDGAKADKEQAAKRADDFKRKAEKLSVELDARAAELGETKLRLADEMGAQDARENALRVEHAEALARAEEIRAASVQAADDRGREEAQRAAAAAKSDADAERERLVAELTDRAASELATAVSQKESALKEDHESKLSTLYRANEDAMNRFKAEQTQLLLEVERATEDKKQVEEALTRDHRAALAARDTEHDKTRGDLSEQRAAYERLLGDKAEAERTRDERIAWLESALSDRDRDLQIARSDVAQREAKLLGISADLDASRHETSDARSAVLAEQAKSERAVTKWTEDRASLERAKDALAVALAQIDEVEGRPLS